MPGTVALSKKGVWTGTLLCPTVATPAIAPTNPDGSTQNPVQPGLFPAGLTQGFQGMGGQGQGMQGRFGSSPISGGFGGFGLGMPGGTGSMPGGMGSMPGGTGSTPGSTTPSVQATAFQKLQTDTQAIMDKSQVTPALQAALRDDIQAIGKAATTAPDEAKLLALQSDLSSLAGTLPTSDQIATLGTDFAAVVASEGVTDATLAPKAITDLNALITATNIGSGDIATLTADLKAAGLSTNAPLGPVLGVKLDILGLAVHKVAPTATTTTATTATTASTTTTA